MSFIDDAEKHSGLVAIAAIIVGWISMTITRAKKQGITQANNAHIEKDINGIGEKVRVIDKRVDEHDVVNAGIEAKLQYIKEGQDRILDLLEKR